MKNSEIWERINRHKEAAEAAIQISYTITSLRRWGSGLPPVEAAVKGLEVELEKWEKIRKDNYQELKEFLLYHPNWKW